MKIALIGKGYWGSKLESYFSQVFEVVLWADSKTDLSEMWGDRDIRGVVIATPIETHYELAKQALESGKHVFVEKPVTLKVSEAEELKQLAEKKGLKVGVDYTQTFSPSILKAKELIGRVGVLRYVEMTTKCLGRFMSHDVFWLLASHHLSVLDMFVSLDRLAFMRREWMHHDGLCTTGTLEFKGVCLPSGRVDVSLNYPGKVMTITFYGSKGTLKHDVMDALTLTTYSKKRRAHPVELTESVGRYEFDELNNLRFSVEYFRRLLAGEVESNLDTAIKVTKVLE